MNLTLGIENFESAIKKYYIDKTLIIKDIVEQGLGSSILVTRPRRFGKSLTVSMIEYFFSNKYDSYKLFENLKIANEKEILSEYLNKFPVIHLNLKDVYGKTSKDIINIVKDKICLLYREYTFLLNSDKILDIEKEEFKEILNKKADETLMASSIYRLSRMLYTHFEKKVIILIDEYDRPLETAFESGCYDDSLPFIKALYKNALKGNNFILFGFLTGVLQIAKESIFSGLNNLNSASLTDVYLNEYFGFTKEETLELLDYFKPDFSFEDVKKWYGGYNLINGNELCNPWSLISAIINNSIDTYWINTASNDLLIGIFDETNLKERVFNLLGTCVSSVQSIKETNYRNFKDNAESLLSFLIQTGYFSYERIGKKYKVIVPNEEILQALKYDILSRKLANITRNKANILLEAFLKGDEEQIAIAIKEFILPTFSYYDLREEKDYQNIVSAVLATIFDDYKVESEVNSGIGRCDILITPKFPEGTPIIIEIKKSSAKKEPSQSNLLKICANAINQIKNNDYLETVRNNSFKKVFIYGLVFHNKKCVIRSETVIF